MGGIVRFKQESFTKILYLFFFSSWVRHLGKSLFLHPDKIEIFVNSIYSLFTKYEAVFPIFLFACNRVWKSRLVPHPWPSWMSGLMFSFNTWLLAIWGNCLREGCFIVVCWHLSNFKRDLEWVSMRKTFRLHIWKESKWSTEYIVIYRS